MLYDKKFLNQLLVLFVGVAALCSVSGGMAIGCLSCCHLGDFAKTFGMASCNALLFAACDLTNQDLIPKTGPSLMIIRGGMVLLGAIMTFMVFGRNKGLIILLKY